MQAIATPLFAAMLMLGGPLGDNAGAMATASYGPFSVLAGAGYGHYGTLTVGPQVSIAAGRGHLDVGVLYAFDRTSAGDDALNLHLLTLRLAMRAPLGERFFISADLAVVRWPLAASAIEGGVDHDVPVDAVDASYLVPGVGLGFRFGP